MELEFVTNKTRYSIGKVQYLYGLTMEPGIRDLKWEKLGIVPVMNR